MSNYGRVMLAAVCLAVVLLYVSRGNCQTPNLDAVSEVSTAFKDLFENEAGTCRERLGGIEKIGAKGQNPLARNYVIEALEFIENNASGNWSQIEQSLASRCKDLVYAGGNCEELAYRMEKEAKTGASIALKKSALPQCRPQLAGTMHQAWLIQCSRKTEGLYAFESFSGIDRGSMIQLISNKDIYDIHDLEPTINQPKKAKNIWVTLLVFTPDGTEETMRIRLGDLAKARDNKMIKTWQSSGSNRSKIFLDLRPECMVFIIQQVD